MKNAKQNYFFQSICDQGAIRPNNEDAIEFGTNLGGEMAWMVIADGMGGHKAGEIASNLLINELKLAFNNLNEQNFPADDDWKCWIDIELNRANNKIFAQASASLEQTGMGTTAVVAVIFNNQCVIGWVGDSRAYLYRDSAPSQLTQMTQDHTMIQLLLDKGAISHKEALESNTKNMLSKAIGVKKGVEVDTLSLSIQSQDIILLSTDGLHDSLEHLSFQETTSLILQGEKVGQILVAEAIKKGSKDNITFGSILVGN